MTGHSDKWIRVSRQDPCPICGKPDNCTVSRDGEMVWCGRVEDGSISQNAGGQFLHRLDGNSRPANLNHTLPPRPKRSPRRDWRAIAKQYFQDGGEARQKLAIDLGVGSLALEKLGVGWNSNGNHWSFPERDANRKFIGINARYVNGSKKRLLGSNAGLTYADDWDAGTGPILLCEGGSDTAALMSIELNAVGRPSNTGGVALLTDLLCDLPSDREIIVLGERDEKPDGRWPGREGAIGTATQLSERLDRTVTWALPPDEGKDARGWLQSMPALPADRLADLFLSGLVRNVVDPPITISVPRVSGRVIPLEEWRDGMLRSRIRSLDRPGFYLDTSTTGSGKSHVDFEVLRYAFAREAS